MKWTVAGAGALLSLAGFYALVSGGSIIQVERGWATFIAGAILLGAGMIVLALSAVIGRLDRLADIAMASAPEAEDWSEPEPEEASEAPVETPVADVPPPPREVRVEALPTLDSRAPAPEPVEPVEAPVAERPTALRNFKFVFPPTDAPSVAAADSALEAEPVAPLENPQPAPRAGLTWLRRAKSEPTPEPETEPLEEQPPVEPAQETAAAHAAEDAAEAATLAGENYDDQVEAAMTPEVEAEIDSEPMAQDEAAPEPAAEAPTAPEPTPDPFSHDWLERALAGADEPRPAPARFKPPSLRRAAPLETTSAETMIEAEAAPAGAVAEPAAEVAAEPDPTPAPAPAPLAAPAPVEIGRYRANDVAYVMFSDGSITAETPAGENYRFGSLVELRAFIERGTV